MCINYKEQAIFTFMVDAKLTIKSAVLDLAKVSSTDGSENMTWAFESTLDQHQIQRFHLKCGVMQPDGSIVVIARGRQANMQEQISGLILTF